VNLDQAPPHALRPEFREGVQALVSTIFSKATPKRMGNTVLTGPMLAGLTQSYVKAINAGAVPTIATAWQVGRARGLFRNLAGVVLYTCCSGSWL
jgi:hypothetical protein